MASINPFDAELYESIKGSNYDGVVKAIDSGANVNGFRFDSYNGDGSNKWFYLYVAIQPCNMQTIQYLISKGADVNSINGPLGWTPLHEAACMGKMDIVTLLLDAGASRTSVDMRNKSVQEIANIAGHGEIGKYIEAYDDILVKGVQE